MYKEFNVKSGFTLAEVLITLSIIGIVAALTIPILIQKQQEQATVTSIKKAYSTLENAFRLAVADDGTPDNWDLSSGTSPTGAENIMNKLASYLSIAKKCGGYGDKGCFPDVIYKTLDGRNSGSGIEINYTFSGFSNWWSFAQLNDGSLLGTYSNLSCEDLAGLKDVCGLFIYDINGHKGPNQDGIDFFWFYLTKTKIIPFGVKADTQYPFPDYCTKSSTIGFNGRGCAAWILYNENLDYLHCDDLSWDGKHKCN